MNTQSDKAKQEATRARRITALLVAPGTIWMLLFLAVPMLMMVYVSFWTQTTFTVEPVLTTKSWVTFFSRETYFGALVTTIRIWLIVLFTTFILGYPAALYIGLFIKNKTIQTMVLVLCIIPFWTSFLIRVLACCACMCVCVIALTLLGLMLFLR